MENNQIKFTLYGAIVCLAILLALNFFILINIQSNVNYNRDLEVRYMDYVEARIESIEIPEATHTVETNTVREICSPEDFSLKADEYIDMMRKLDTAILDEQLNEGFGAFLIFLAIDDGEISEYDRNLLDAYLQYYLNP